MLREFWFPIFLALAGTVPGIVGSYADGITRKWWWTVTAAMWFLAAVSYIWGDPVRGPFYTLIEPKAPDTFYFHAGINAGFPVKDLSEGIDFGRVISTGQKPPPIELRVSRTWWSGWQYNGLLRVSPQHTIKFTNKSISGLPSGWDYNNDEYAMEIINAEHHPIFQLIQSSDQDIYINSVVDMGDGRAMVLNGERLMMGPRGKVLAELTLQTLFRYPRYANAGKRK